MPNPAVYALSYSMARTVIFRWLLQYVRVLFRDQDPDPGSKVAFENVIYYKCIKDDLKI